MYVSITEVQEMELHLPRTNRVNFEDPNKLHSFTVTISPDDGYWQGGRFKFHIDVPEDYNIVVSHSLILSQNFTSTGWFKKHHL